VLFVYDAHDLSAETPTGLKRLIEKPRDNGAMLSLVLAGHLISNTSFGATPSRKSGRAP
jgi:type II secretory pathway predicted ATPase ExeA